MATAHSHRIDEERLVPRLPAWVGATTVAPSAAAFPLRALLRRGAVTALLVLILFGAIDRGTAHAADGTPWVIMNVSAYCLNGVMANGWWVHNGAVAAPPNIPFGSLVEIEGLGVFRVEDRGSAITYGHLDVWVPNCWTAEQFGRRYPAVRLLRYGWFGQ